MSKTYVFGDIHGCCRELSELLDRINPDPQQDTLVFLGDYVDRGPDAKGVVDSVLQLSATFERVVTLKGNHEEAFLDYLQGENISFYLSIGGIQTLKSYGLDFSVPPSEHQLPEGHIDFFQNLLPYWEDEKNIYVHAGLEPGVHLSLQSLRWLLWADGDHLLHRKYDFGKRVIFGHTVQANPVITEDRIAVDAGAVYGGSLACLVLPDENFVQVKSGKYWAGV